LTKALNLAEEAMAADIMAAVQALRVGAEQGEAVQEEMAALKVQMREEVAARVVEEALTQGKISPAQRAWAVEYCRQDMGKFQAYVAQAPKVVPVGEELPPFGNGEGGRPGLLAHELAICRSMGILPEIFHEAKAEMERARK
jgi:phage I-like protein